MNSSKEIHTLFPDLAVWQRSYHEHVIRGEDDHREILEYIESNPAKWAEDRYDTDCAAGGTTSGVFVTVVSIHRAA